MKVVTMSDCLRAARWFAEAPPPRLDLRNLAAALLLEYFAWPILHYTNYVRLARRDLLPTLEDEFRAWLATITPVVMADSAAALQAWVMQIDAVERQHILALLVHGVERRRTIRRHSNWTSQAALMTVLGLHLLTLLTVVWLLLTAWMTGLELLAGWFFAVAFATLICLTDRHWRPRAGFRRIPRGDT